MAVKPEEYKQPEYVSKNQGQLDAALGKIVDRQEFTYDPLKDANYQSLAKLYEKKGNQAAQNTLGDAAALNGGYGSSFALTAAQQQRNDFNQQLASQIPALQDAAYNRYLNNYNMDVTALGALRDADESDYGRFRDTVADNQWNFAQKYQQYRDETGDEQWQKNYDRGVLESDRAYNYQVERDKVSDSQWAQEFALQKKSAAASRYGGSSDGGLINGVSDGLDKFINAVEEKANKKGNKTTKKTTTKKSTAKKYTEGQYGQLVKAYNNSKKR